MRRAGLARLSGGADAGPRGAEGAALIFKYGSIRQRSAVSAVSVLVWRLGVGLFASKAERHAHGLRQ